MQATSRVELSNNLADQSRSASGQTRPFGAPPANVWVALDRGHWADTPAFLRSASFGHFRGPYGCCWPDFLVSVRSVHPSGVPQ
jgi:hypothetical protein